MLLLIKLTITPVLVGCMSLAIRYWGPTTAGILIGLPWMTGPVLFILGLDKGTGWVAGACTGVQLGTVALAGYAMAYVLSARRFGWFVSQMAGSLAFGALAIILHGLDIGPRLAPLLSAGSLIACYRLIKIPANARAPGPLPWWDIPARMLATALLVLVIAFSADALGPTWSGIIATYPVIMTVIGTFTHAQWGGGATTVLFRAVLLSLISFVVFFVVVEASAQALGLVWAYALAVVASVATSSTNLLLRRNGFLR
jgi:hypothetical protein